MTHINRDSHQCTEISLGQKIHNALTGLVILAITAASLCIVFPDFFSNLDRLIARHSYVAFNPWSVPFIIGSPLLLLLCYGIGLRVLNRATDKKINWIVNKGLYIAIATVLTGVTYGISAPVYLKSLGYSNCWSLSSPSFMSSSIYVKSSQYCLENVGSVRKELLLWMDTTSAAHQPLNLEEFKAQANKLLNIQK